MSLRKVSVSITGRGWLFKRWYFYFTKTKYFVLDNNQYEHALGQIEESGVARIGRDGNRVLWWAAHGGFPTFFWAGIELSDEDVELLIWDRLRKQDTKLDRLRKIRARQVDLEMGRRERIPDDVRAFVWERDEGRCTKCGAQEELQFDHIIPVAKGGGNAIDNIQILCGNCNRQKSDHIA